MNRLLVPAMLLSAAASRAQVSTTGAPRRVAVLEHGVLDEEGTSLRPFFAAMEQLGWVEGGRITYDRRNANDRRDLLPALAADLVAGKPDLIYAPFTPAAQAAKQATNTIPIIFSAVAIRSRPAWSVRWCSRVATSRASA